MGVVSEDYAPFRSPGGLQGSVVNPTVVASAVAQAVPTALITTLSGTAALSTLGIPFPGFTGFIILLPVAAFTGVTGGVATATALPIKIAFTAVPGRPVLMVCDGQFWYPAV